ncbi:uncharacterized protein LOC118740357 [Rhagoletis pomonella]|uniref:uncharacterized protein LOC118740357 n=1 Tax=Rhagoletis pomonella TaxID=28610 RepID=UPI001785BD89|nr:uncharacterized protein LOC118740357 [Rhagoletis pomonella]
MFRQIEVDLRHRVWQQILWKESPNDPLRTYQLSTVTYGMPCSPSNAVRALKQCAIDNHGIITDACRAAVARNSIAHNFYVDDYLDSVDDANEALTRKFEVCEWNSNSAEVLKALNGFAVSTSEMDLG